MGWGRVPSAPTALCCSVAVGSLIVAAPATAATPPRGLPTGAVLAATRAGIVAGGCRPGGGGSLGLSVLRRHGPGGHLRLPWRAEPQCFATVQASDCSLNGGE